jgi:hypothetical protein
MKGTLALMCGLVVLMAGIWAFAQQPVPDLCCRWKGHHCR